MSEVIWFLTFSAWLIFLSVVSSRSILAVTNGRISYLLRARSVPLCIWTTSSLSNYLLKDTSCRGPHEECCDSPGLMAVPYLQPWLRLPVHSPVWSSLLKKLPFFGGRIVFQPCTVREGYWDAVRRAHASLNCLSTKVSLLSTPLPFRVTSTSVSASWDFSEIFVGKLVFLLLWSLAGLAVSSLKRPKAVPSFFCFPNV